MIKHYSEKIKKKYESVLSVSEKEHKKFHRFPEQSSDRPEEENSGSTEKMQQAPVHSLSEVGKQEKGSMLQDKR